MEIERHAGRSETQKHDCNAGTDSCKGKGRMRVDCTCWEQGMTGWLVARPGDPKRAFLSGPEALRRVGV